MYGDMQLYLLKSSLIYLMSGIIQVLIGNLE